MNDLKIADYKSGCTRNQPSQTPVPSEPLTIVAVRLDPGMPNVPFIRGQGNGLSWDKGRPLSYLDDGVWVWATRQTGEKLICKLLLDDRTWAKGEDLVVRPGTKIEIAPRF